MVLRARLMEQLIEPGLQHELRSYEVRERTLDGLSRDAARRGDGADLG
jgi:hypothetical protein